MEITHEAYVKAKDRMEKTLEALKNDLSSIRAGRANPHLLDRIMVDYYGTQTPISQVGNVSSPDPKMLVISLWDTSILGEVEKAIMKSDLGINPANDGKVIRLAFPDVTEERRKELVKMAKKNAETSKVAIRNIRRDANDVLKKEKKDSTITEDDYNDLEKEIQKMTDDMIKKVDVILADKEKEIMEI